MDSKCNIRGKGTLKIQYIHRRDFTQKHTNLLCSGDENYVLYCVLSSRKNFINVFQYTKQAVRVYWLSFINFLISFKFDSFMTYDST